MTNSIYHPPIAAPTDKGETDRRLAGNRSGEIILKLTPTADNTPADVRSLFQLLDYDPITGWVQRDSCELKWAQTFYKLYT